MSMLRGAVGGLLILFLTGCDTTSRYTEIITVTPRLDPAVITTPPRISRARNDAMLATFQTFGDLPVMTFFGDFGQAVDFQHHLLMRRFTSDAPATATIP